MRPSADDLPQGLALDANIAIRAAALGTASSMRYPKNRTIPISLDISPKTEARLAAKAQEQGISIDALLDQLLNDADVLRGIPANGPAPQLPVWNLGVRGSLHRRDMYDGVY